MTELLSSGSNYINYRRLYNECGGFKVPILGVHLKDLISLNEALPDYIDQDKINLSKLQHLYSNISDLVAIHSCTPPFEANKDLLHLLTVRDRDPGMIYFYRIRIEDIGSGRACRQKRSMPCNVMFFHCFSSP